MDTILVLTDFSPTTDNALNYAIRLAETTGAGIILLNLQTPSENLQAEYDMRLKRNHTPVAIELLMQSGSAEEVISRVSEEKQADLIIVGMKEGANFEETMLGANAMDTIRNSATPFLIIPDKATFRSLQPITLNLKTNKPFIHF
jgi:nucleotide-binding universal stress UspA family protein